MIRPRYLIICADLLIAFIALVSAYPLRFLRVDSLAMLWSGGAFRVVGYFFIIVFCTYFFDLYEIRYYKDKIFIWRRVAATFAAAFVLLSAYFYLFRT